MNILAPHVRRAIGQSARPTFAMLVGVLCLFVPIVVRAQTAEQPGTTTRGQGALPDAAFETTFRKYVPPDNVFSPYYSWDAHMALGLTVLRKGPNAVEFSGTFQTVGTENLGTRVSVGGTGYLLGLAYVREYSDSLSVSAGITHLSSHLTRDLDQKTDKQRDAGVPIPTVEDPSEYNIVFLKGRLNLPHCRFTPELVVVIEPINFRFDGRPASYVRPVFLSTRWTMWKSHQKSLVAETQHEVGHNSFNGFFLFLELYPGDQPEGRFQVFVSGSPGRGLHVSPNIGALRDGIAFGIRMRFRSGRWP